MPLQTHMACYIPCTRHMCMIACCSNYNIYCLFLPPVVVALQSDYASCEGTPVTVCVDISGEVSAAVDFSIATVNTGTATGTHYYTLSLSLSLPLYAVTWTTHIASFPTVQLDYLPNSQQYSFSTNDAIPCLDVTTLEDSLLESCETFGLALTAGSNPGVNLILSPSTATGTIYDDEGLYFLIYNFLRRCCVIFQQLFSCQVSILHTLMTLLKPLACNCLVNFLSVNPDALVTLSVKLKTTSRLIVSLLLVHVDTSRLYNNF